MRLAVVAASSYRENGQVAPIPNAELDLELFARRLAEPDAGFEVHGFAAERGLQDGVEALLQARGGRARSLLFYFWGYALLSEERGPALLLDGPRLAPLTLARLRAMLSRLSEQALVIIDASVAPGSTGTPLEAVRAMGAALGAGSVAVSSLIAVRSAASRVEPGPPAFTGLLQLLLDTQTGSASALTPESLFRSMQAEEVMFADIPAAGCFLGPSEFLIVPGVVPPSAPAPPVAASAQPVIASAQPSANGSFAVDDPDGYRFLLRHYERKGEADAAYRAAECLDALGAADISESLLAAAHRPQGLQPVQRALSYADWSERLRSGLQHPEITALLRSVASALPRVGFQRLRRQRRERLLPETARHELETSTTMLARTLAWVSRLLCVPVSGLYVLPEHPGALGLTPGAERPLLACSRALGTGFTLPELVFLWARELSFARPEEAALCYFPSVAELSRLVLAALALGGGKSLGSIDAESRRIASGLKREVRGSDLDALCAAAQGWKEQSPSAEPSLDEVTLRVTDFVRGAELLAGRVGLVACGHLEQALVLGERFPRGEVTAARERRGDLLRFAVSAELGQIRKALGVAVG